MDEFEIRYTRARHLPDMQAHGFLIQTCYGSLLVRAEESGDFIAAVQRLLAAREAALRAARTEGAAAPGAAR